MAKEKKELSVVKTQETSVALNQEEMFKMYSEVVSPGSPLTKTQFAWYVNYCNQRGADPMGKDIYLVPRNVKQPDGTWKKVMTPQSSIDWFRKRATQSSAYAGQDGPYWCGSDGTWHDIWLSDKPPAAAKVGVMRAGFQKPVWGIALYSEYAQKSSDGKPTDFWKRMPANQLAKCAESLALRKAFPDQFGGVYTSEEMAQSDVVDVDHVPVEAPVTKAVAAPVEDYDVTQEIPDDNNVPPPNDEVDEEFEARYQAALHKPEPVPMQKAVVHDAVKAAEKVFETEGKPSDAPTKEEIAAIKAAWKRIKKNGKPLTTEQTIELLNVLTDGRKSDKWTRSDFNNIVDFLGKAYEAPDGL